MNSISVFFEQQQAWRLSAGYVAAVRVGSGQATSGINGFGAVDTSNIITKHNSAVVITFSLWPTDNWRPSLRSRYTLDSMADSNDSVLDKAETFARRILERLGSGVDTKLASANEQTLTPNVIADLASRVEQVIESNLEKDENGVRRVAPNRFKVLFTYEETSKLSPQYIESVGKELTSTVIEYSNNRRYSTRGPIVVEVGRDLFAKTTSVKATFDGQGDQPATRAQARSNAEAVASCAICFNSSDGRSYRVELKPDGAPGYIGRAAGNAVRIDDPSVSRLHCSLSARSNGDVVIADVGSSNGTYVNANLLGRDEARLLSTGDIVGVGDFKLTVSAIAGDART